MSAAAWLFLALSVACLVAGFITGDDHFYTNGLVVLVLANQAEARAQARQDSLR